jgi:2-polyprenyl-3-methyl-5-hydroxy-6-metoxy-1,4-benzoquinol methylase
MARQGLPIDLVAAVNLREELKEQIRREIAAGSDAAEAVIRRLVPLSNGFGYRDLAPGDAIPIPRFPERGGGESLLDIGSSWGRWTIAAAGAGFRAVGVDPMLGPLMAAKRFAAKQGVDVDYICGDARCLPFANGAFDRTFSYSTLQHFSDRDCALTLGEIARVLGAEGISTVQMANWAGVRSLWHQARRGFREPARFEVRYRSLRQMRAMFAGAIGPTTVSIDCFFGLGLQASDARHMRPLARVATAASEQLKRMAKLVPALRSEADSVFMHSAKKPHQSQPQGS